MKTYYLIILHIVFLSCIINAQTKSISLNNNQDLVFINVNSNQVSYNEKEAIFAKTIEGGKHSIIRIGDLDFTDGTIELDLSAIRSEDAHPMSRGFVGLAFRVNENNSVFDCFYLRAANGRADDQLQRNHTAQYMAIPGYEWNVLRKEFPGKYETYVDMTPGKWTKIKVEIDGNKAKLYVHGSDQPTLIVNDLLSSNSHGGIALWLGGGTDAHFANLKVTKKK